MSIQTKKFARKPFYVDAVQVTLDNMEEVASWCRGDVRKAENSEGDKTLVPYIKVRVHRPLTERQTQAFAGDWILYAGTGYKVYTQKAFEKSFEVAQSDDKPLLTSEGITQTS